MQMSNKNQNIMDNETLKFRLEDDLLFISVNILLNVKVGNYVVKNPKQTYSHMDVN